MSEYVEKEFDQLVNQLSDMAESIAHDTNISNSDLRRTLRFLSKVIQIVEQAFQDVLSTLIEFKYLTDEDLSSGRLRELAKELELLQARSRYRDALEICSRLHHLGDFYRSEISPITNVLPNQESWREVFRLLDEYEGRIIGLVGHSISELQSLISQTNVKEINSVAGRDANAIKESLTRLRSLNSQILGLSGSAGLLEMTEDQESLNTTRLNIYRGDIQMGDTYTVGQGIAGKNVHAHDITFQHVGDQIRESFDLSELAEELSKLRQAMKQQATGSEHDIAVSEVAKAEQAARSKDTSKIAEYLKSAGSWALDIASKIGVPLAIGALKLATGI